MITFHLMELDCIRGTSQYITQDTFGDTITTNMHNFNYAINLESGIYHAWENEEPWLDSHKVCWQIVIEPIFNIKMVKLLTAYLVSDFCYDLSFNPSKSPCLPRIVCYLSRVPADTYKTH